MHYPSVNMSCVQIWTTLLCWLIVAMLANRLLERQKLDNGNAWPETIAVVLWGTDNIKTYGESLAQVHMCYQQSCCADQKYCWPCVLLVLSELTVCMSVSVVHRGFEASTGPCQQVQSFQLHSVTLVQK